MRGQLTQIHELGQQMRAGEQARHDQQREFLLGLVEILDAFERKEESLRERYADSADGQQVIKSYATIHKRVTQQLARHGVVPIPFPENRLIVGLTEVVGTEPNATLPNETILAIIRPGYIRTNEVLRMAEVIVVRN